MSSIGDDRLDLHRTQRPAPVLFSEIYLVDTRPESDLFGSDWYDSGSVDAYVVELPAYQTLIQSE